MAEHSTLGEIFQVYGEYPHSLMQHILTLLRLERKNEDWLITEEFQKSFLAKYSEYPAEVRELQIAAGKGVLRGFSEYREVGEEQQKNFIQNSLVALVGELREFEAVELVESLMWVFGWEIVADVTRRWEVSAENKAKFHNYGELDVYSSKQKKAEKKENSEEEEQKKPAPRLKWNGAKKQKPMQKENSETQEALNTGQEKKESAGQAAAVTKNTLDKERFFKIILGMDLMEEEKYRKILQEIRIDHENKMSLSMRKELKRARRGNEISQKNLADFYAEESTDHTDYYAAAMWYSFAARQGNDKARLELAKLLDGKKLFGDELEFNAKNPTFHPKRYAILYFKELAEKGFSAAQGILGMKYYLGDGVRKSTTKGISWLKKAAEQGQVEAQKQLGEIYSEIDEAESQKWFRKAGANGDLWAKNRIKQ